VLRFGIAAAISILPISSFSQALYPQAKQPIVVKPAVSPATTLFGQAASDYQAGRLDKAATELRSYIALKPSDAIARGLLGYLELKSGGDIDRATADLVAAVKLDPKDVTNINNLATAYVEQRKWSTAVPLLRQVSSAQPKDVIAKARLASALAQSGDIPTALAIYAKLVAQPNCPLPVVQNDAMTLAHVQRYAEAAAMYDRASALDPTDAAAWNSAGICYSKVGKEQDAVRCLGEALKLGPADPYRTRFLYATALAETGQVDAALKQFQYTTVLKPDEFAGWYNVGLLNQRLGQDKDAIAAYEQAHQLAPENDAAILNLTAEQIKTGQTSDAITLIQSALQQNPKDESLHAGLAAVYITQANIPAAESEFKTALTLKPDDNLTRAKLADLYADSKDWKDAEPEYEILAKAAPDSDSLLNQLGESLQQLRRYPEAQTALQHAVELNPKNAIAWNNLGAVHEQLGQVKAAIADYKKAAQLDPTMTEPRANLARLSAAASKPLKPDASVQPASQFVAPQASASPAAQPPAAAGGKPAAAP
jgi:Flp pilus assembly protein TadD